MAFEADPYSVLNIERSTYLVGPLFRRWAHEVYTGVKSERDQIRISYELIDRLGESTVINSVNRAMIKKLVDDLKLINKPATINTKLSVLSRLLGCAVEEDIIESVPKMPFFTLRNGRTRVLTKEEEEALFAHMPPDYRQLTIFLLYTGCRLSEALTLRWEDIDIEDGSVTFWDTKNGKARTVPLARKAKEALGKVPVAELASWYVMVEKVPYKPRRDLANGGEGPFTQFERLALVRRWNTAKKLAKLDDPTIVRHTLRHTCATRLGRKGFDTLKLMKWLGHSSVKMVEKYTHLDTNSLRLGCDLLD
jgi:integrase